MEYFTPRNFTTCSAILQVNITELLYKFNIRLDEESIQSFSRKGREKISTERTFIVLMYSQVRVLWRRIMQIARILPLPHATQVSRKLIAARICPWCTQRSVSLRLVSFLLRAGPRTSRNFLRSRNPREYEMNYPHVSTAISSSVFTKFTLMSKFISNEAKNINKFPPSLIVNKFKWVCVCVTFYYSISLDFIMPLINSNNYKLNRLS